MEFLKKRIVEAEANVKKYAERFDAADQTLVDLKAGTICARVHIRIIQSMKPPGEIDFILKRSMHLTTGLPDVSLYSILVRATRYTMRVKQYSDLKHYGLYALERPGDNFSGYAEVQARVQVEDTVASICSGGVAGFEVWANACVEFESTLKALTSVRRSPPPLKWGFPIKPDALLIKGELNQDHIKQFSEKLDYLRAHSRSIGVEGRVF